MSASLARQLAAEALGTALLLATVVGSGIMGDTLSGGNANLALLANSLATGAILTVLILALGPLSGAHFNPAVTLAFLLRGELPVSRAIAFMACQCVAAVAGVWIAHLMFAQPMLQTGTIDRFHPHLWFAELVAAFGLIFTILAVRAARPGAVAAAVGLYIGAAYWFTASTSFANPAVTLARSLTDTFSGIAPAGVAPFLLAQVLGALAATWFATWLLAGERP